MGTHYTNVGSVTGECGHRHRHPWTAQQCLDRFARAVERGHGSNAYSDRRMVAVEDGEPRPLTDDEWYDATQ